MKDKPIVYTLPLRKDVRVEFRDIPLDLKAAEVAKLVTFLKALVIPTKRGKR